jgi:hypothetical protein
MSTQDWGWLNNLFNVAGQVGSVYNALNYADNTAELGATMQQQLNGIGQQANQGSQFQGYGLTSSLGTTNVGSDGSVNFGVGQNQAYNDFSNTNMQYANQAMQQSMQNPYEAQQSIYNDMMAVQNPVLNQQQAQQQAREYAMGRGGIRGSAFGGTAEDAAMARARAQASNEAAFASREQAMSEMGQYADMANAYGNMGMDAYKTSFIPMSQQAALWQLAGADADRYQTGQLTGQGYLTQLGLAGAEANLNAQNIANQTRANLYDSILDNMGGQNSTDGGVSGIIGLLSGILGG